MHRRRFLQLAAAAAAAGSLPARAAPSADQARDRKLLFVLCAYGGASIIDSFAPVVDYEGGDLLAAAQINAYPDTLVETVPGRALRAVKVLDKYAFYAKPKQPMSTLVANHGADMAVICHEVSSVNHTVGQQRSLNGAGFDRGRTIMETVAMRHGMGLPLPSCNMAVDGYARPGVDASVPQAARHEIIRSPKLFGAGTHGFTGLAGAPSAANVAAARAVREQLDKKSIFARTFAKDARLASYLQTRSDITPGLEQAGLLEKLLLIDPNAIDPKYGVKPDPLAVSLRSTLPDLDQDRMQAQVALAFLVAYHGVSTSISMGYDTDPTILSDGSIVGSPLSFDFSHNMHRVVQSLMWSRTAGLVDSLITLLKTHDYLGDPSLGKMWDRSLVYIATEFGRDKKRPFLSDAWGTGHDLNNGSVLLSPLLKGNALYGGVDPLTGLSYGFDTVTGQPDKNKQLGEADIYGIIAEAMGTPIAGAPSYAAVVRG